MLKNLRETEQRGQALALGLAFLNQLSQIDTHIRTIRIGADANMTQFIDVIVVIAPPGNVVGPQHQAGVLIVHRHLLH